MGETLTAIISAECQTAALAAGTIATNYSAMLLNMKLAKRDVIAGVCGAIIAVAVWIFVVKGGAA